MKHVVVFDGLRELSIRPRELFDEYAAAVARDAARLLEGRAAFVPVPCPGCGEAPAHAAFTKHGFEFLRCRICRSLYVSPRPTPETLAAFLPASEGLVFWNRRFAAATAVERVGSIFRPRAAWVEDATGRERPRVLVDFQTRYAGFLRALAEGGAFDRLVSADPQIARGELTGIPGCEVAGDVERLAAAAPGSAAAVSIQEGLERAADPGRLLAAAARILRPHGMLFVTTVAGTGFEIQVLGPFSRSVLPPVQWNLLSLEGIQRLLVRHAFATVELSTPGQLDLEIVRLAAEQEADLRLPPFVEELVRHRGPEAHQAFQEVLQQTLMSTHVRLSAQRAGAA